MNERRLRSCYKHRRRSESGKGVQGVTGARGQDGLDAWLFLSTYNSVISDGIRIRPPGAMYYAPGSRQDLLIRRPKRLQKASPSH